MMNHTSERDQSAPRPGWFFPLCIALLMAITPSFATECSCRDPIPADSSGNGTCTKTQNGSQSCKLDWNSGGSREQNSRVLNELQRQGASLPDVGGPGDDSFERAASALFTPQQPSATLQAMATLIAGALGRNAPDRLGLYRAFLSKFSDGRYSPLFLPDGGGSVSREQLVADGRNYNVAITSGCVQFRDDQFLLVLKTRFARVRRDCDETPR